MSYINQIVEDGVTYDIAAKNLVNGFTQTTPGVNALDAAAGKSLNDSLANLSTDVSTNYATKTDLSNLSTNVGANSQYGESYNNIEATFTIPRGHNVALLLGMRGSIGFAYLFTYWDATPFKIWGTGTAPTITKTANSDTIKVSHSNSGTVAMMFITGFEKNS